MTVRLLDHQVYLGGKGLKQFWLHGDDVFRNLDEVVTGAANVAGQARP